MRSGPVASTSSASWRSHEGGTVDLVLKAVAGRERDMVREFTTLVRQLAGDRVARAARIHRVFPEGTSGHRGRLFTAELPEGLEESLLRDLVASLVDNGLAEYAGPPSRRRPL
jgi:hypothetical protein